MSLIEWVRRFRSLRAVVIGDAMLDSYLEGSAARLCTEGPVPVVRKTEEERSPGGAANTAANLRGLGAEVAFLSAIGDDVAGRLLRELLLERDVDTSSLITDPTCSTLHKLRILADDQYVVRYDEGETCLRGETRDALVQALEREVPRSDVVVVSDYAYGLITSELIDALRRLRRRHPVPLIVDSKDVRRFRSAGATIVTPNHLEARLAVEGSARYEGPLKPDEAEHLARRLLTAIDAEHVAVTMAEHGVVLVSRGGESAHLPAHPVARAGDVGAGDTFTSALALSLAAGATPVDAARIGIEAGGIAVGRRRTTVVSHGELLQRVSRSSQPAAPTIEVLRDVLEEVRAAGKTIVFTNGVFDILHAGHVRFLQQAKALGDVLVVGVNTDAGARRLKGKNRPINSERDRLALVAALEPVDHVVLFDEAEPSALIRALRPHLHVKGGDYQYEALPEAEAVRDVAGRIVILPLAGDLSTSTVIERILSLNGASPSPAQETGPVTEVAR